jgi:hypothetical protein
MGRRGLTGSRRDVFVGALDEWHQSHAGDTYGDGCRWPVHLRRPVGARFLQWYTSRVTEAALKHENLKAAIGIELYRGSQSPLL